MNDLQKLQKKAWQLRLDCIEAVHASALKHGHLGGCLSMAEIIAALYYHFLRVDPANPLWPERDRMILSKGHNCLMQYAALADRGYFPRELLASYKSLGSPLQGHPDMHKCPGIDFTTGSLGQGLSIGVGMCLSARRNAQDYRTYVIMSDGEMQEGMTWEAAMAAAHYKLDNLVCIVDRNNLQVNGETQTIMNIEPLEQKFAAFGWNTLRIDGHNMRQIVSALKYAQSQKGAPFVLICDTVKGKGVGYMENVMEWHAKVLEEAQYQQAVNALKRAQAMVGQEVEDEGSDNSRTV